MADTHNPFAAPGLDEKTRENQQASQWNRTHVKEESVPNTVEQKNAKIAREEKVRQDKLAEIQEIKVQIDKKNDDLTKLTLKQNEQVALLNVENEKAKELIREDIVNLQDKQKQLAEEAKVESEEAKILREHGGLESNIPINHPYWRLRQ